MTDDEALRQNTELVSIVATAISNGDARRAGVQPETCSPNHIAFREAEDVVAALSPRQRALFFRTARPCFDEIQEAVHRVRKGKSLPPGMVERVILPALRNFSDSCYPETADQPPL